MQVSTVSTTNKSLHIFMSCSIAKPGTRRISRTERDISLETVRMEDANLNSAIQCSNGPESDKAVHSLVSGDMEKAVEGLIEGKLQVGYPFFFFKLIGLPRISPLFPTPTLYD